MLFTERQALTLDARKVTIATSSWSWSREQQYDAKDSCGNSTSNSLERTIATGITFESHRLAPGNRRFIINAMSDDNAA